MHLIDKAYQEACGIKDRYYATRKELRRWPSEDVSKHPQMRELAKQLRKAKRAYADAILAIGRDPKDFTSI